MFRGALRPEVSITDQIAILFKNFYGSSGPTSLAIYGRFRNFSL